MNKRFSLISLLLLFSVTSLAAQNRPKIAVTKLEPNNVSITEARVLTDRLRDELFQTGKFDVLEREKMESIIDEMKIQLSGLTAEQYLPKIGDMLGVEQIVGGSVSKVNGSYHVSVRMISVSTSRVMKVANEEYRGDFDGVNRFVIPKIALTLADSETNKPSIRRVFMVKPKIQLNAKIGNPYYLPNAETDNFQSAYAFGFEVLFGRKVYAGLSFDYSKFSEEKQARTSEIGPDILGFFTPVVTGQFYSFALYYKPSPKAENRKMAPFGGIKAGIVKRTFDIGLENYAKVDDSQRFGLDVIAGLEFPVTQFLNINASMDYFMTSEKKENDWKPTFNAARSFVAAHIGFGVVF